MTIFDFIEAVRDVPFDTEIMVADWNEGWAESVLAGVVFDDGKVVITSERNSKAFDEECVQCPDCKRRCFGSQILCKTCGGFGKIRKVVTDAPQS